MILNQTLVLTAIVLAALSLTACDNNGGSSKTESQETTITPQGTKIERKTETETEVDEEGNRSSTVDTETTVDPEGLMNKETIEERHEEVE